MASDDPRDDDEARLAERLADYDEELRQDGPAEAEGQRDSAASSSDDVADLQECLLRLERRFPRGGHGNLAETIPGNRPPSDAEAGERPVANRIGRFRIERELGRGGFGVVFLAFDPALDRYVALKVPRLDTMTSVEMRKRFLHEAKAAAALDHPNIVPIYEVGEAGTICYIALAYCEGADLARWLAERDDPLGAHQAAEIVIALADAVEHGHQRGILHRDLKPGNVMLVPKAERDDPEGNRLPFTPRLTDFGMAKLVDAGLTQTRSSLIIGTPLYMSPEQAESRTRDIGPASDVYALGAILYELLTGHPPFDEESLVGILDRLRSDDEADSPARNRPSIPADLETICLKCLRKDPAQRYSSAGELAADLRRFLRGEPIAARKVSRPVRLWNWMQRRQRIREAGLLMIWLNAIVAGWVLLNASAGVLRDYAVSAEWPSFVRDCFGVSAVHLSAAWLGIQMLRERRWAIRTGTIAAFLLFVVAILMAGGTWLRFGRFYENPVTRAIVFDLLCTLLAVQLIACVVAVVADVRLHAKSARR